VTYVHDGDGLLTRGTEVLDHVLDEHGTLSDLALWERVSLMRDEGGGEWRKAHTGDDLDIVAGNQLDLLLAFRRHGDDICGVDELIS
jgi:hypothetical protein